MSFLRPAVLLTLFALPLGWRAERKYREMAELPRSVKAHHRTNAPSLSIVIPSRNEVKNLKRLLPSLRALEYPGSLEIIVVDDQSDDGTGALAETFGAQVIPVDTLPKGWKGKPHACHIGALAARGEWLLFTDADTRHEPESAAQAVAFAQDHALDGLTLFLKQRIETFLDGAVLMTAFAGLFAGMREGKPLMNGQYILLRRAVYLESGGFEAVRNEALEDLAFGNRLRKRGYTVPALRGESAAVVQMYDSRGQMWHGMTRLGAGSLKWSGGGAVVTALFTTAVMSPLIVLAGVLTGRLRFMWLLATWLAASASVIPFARRFGGMWRALFAPFGAMFVLLAAMWGLASRVIGLGIVWRGREV